jgi:hypothetical protein
MSLAVYHDVELIGQTEEVDMKILHNMIVYPKVKIYSSRSSADSFDDYVLYLYYLFIYI